MKSPTSIEEIVELDGDTLWESLCWYFGANDVYIDDVEERAYPMDDLYKVVIVRHLLEENGATHTAWFLSSDIFAIYNSYVQREAVLDKIGQLQ